MKSIRISIIGVILGASLVASAQDTQDTQDMPTLPSVAECHDLLTSPMNLRTRGIQQLISMATMAYQCKRAFPSQEEAANPFMGAIAMEESLRFKHYVQRHGELDSFQMEDDAGKR